MTEYAKKTWEYLVKHGLTEEGTAGLMGNLQAESGIIPNRVEILCLKRLKEHGQIYTDATYTAFVDDGTITRAQFLNPLPGKRYGYGLAQWTSPSRKAGLYDLCKSKGVSIGDLTTQLEWLMTELKTSYQSVYNVLTTTTDIKAASDIVLTKFECPADTGTSVKNTRYKYGKAIYDELKGSVKVDKPKSNDEAVKKVIGIAEGEIGYLEKASNKDLDSKTSNAGSNNYTKYWRDVYPAYQGQPWCACFVSWCMMKAFGLETAKKLLKHWPFVYCPTLASMTTNKTPKVGSVVLFYRNGTYAHTGLVVAVTKTQITTIEGNTSGASGIIPNGGGVCRKTYARSSLASQTKYFMPDYSIVMVKEDTDKGSASSGGSAAPSKPSSSGSSLPFGPINTSGKLNETPKGKGKVTASSLNVRTWAGTGYARLKSYPSIPKGTIVEVCDTITDTDANPWYYIRINGKVYGFVSAKYIEKV